MPKDAGCSRCRLPSGRSILPSSWREAAPGCSCASLASGTCGVCGCHTNPPLVPGQPGREVPGRAGGKGRTRSQGQPGALPAGEALSASPGEPAGTAGYPGPAATPASPCNFAARRGPAGWHGTERGGSPGHPAPLPSLGSAFLCLSPGRGIAAAPPAPSPGPSGPQPACTGASQHPNLPAGCLPPASGAWRLPRCRALPVPAPPGWTRRRCPQLAPGRDGSAPPRASPAARRSWGAVCRPAGVRLGPSPVP